MNVVEIVIAVAAVLAAGYGTLKADVQAVGAGTILAAVDLLVILVK